MTPLLEFDELARMAHRTKETIFFFLDYQFMTEDIKEYESPAR